MHPHSYSDLLAAGPLVPNKHPLHLDHRRSAGAGRGEHGEEPVALGTDLPAVVRGEAGPDDLVVIGQDLGIGVATQTTEDRRRALYVGEEECERVRGAERKRLPGHLQWFQPGRTRRRWSATVLTQGALLGTKSVSPRNADGGTSKA